MNNRNELTGSSRSGTLTVSGTTGLRKAQWEWDGGVTNVTVSGTGLSSGSADLYEDGTWARRGATMQNGNNSYTALAKDTLGRESTDTVSVYAPASVTFTYDLNGNLTGDGLRVFEYDYENQLTNVYVANQWKSEFAYDALMRRRVRKEYSWSGSAWVKTNEVRYVYDGRLVIQERDENNVPRLTYTRGLDLSGSLEGAGGIGGLLARSESLSSVASGGEGSTSYYHSDASGNITCMVDGNGTVVARYAYDPYGNILSMSGSLAEANLYRFSSKEAHVNSGLVYYLFRYYEPNLQRWVNEDPIGNLGFSIIFAFVPDMELPFPEFEAPNLAIYLGNAPLTYFDPFGLFPPSNPTCQRLAEKIRNIENKIASRERDLRENPGELPGKAVGDKQHPRISRRGHQMLINKDKANLAAKKALYLAYCSDPEPPPKTPFIQPIFAGGPVTQNRVMAAGVVGAVIVTAATGGAPALGPAGVALAVP